MINPLVYFLLFLKASLFSTSGTGNLPILHDDLLARGWANERQFAESLAVGQISPGPSGLWVISLGYLTHGLSGALMATVAISLPPLLIVAVDRLHRRIGDHPAVEGFVRGLSLAVIGVFLVVLFRLITGNGIDLGTVLIMLATIALGLTRRIPVIGIIALAGAAGALIYR